MDPTTAIKAGLFFKKYGLKILFYVVLIIAGIAGYYYWADYIGDIREDKVVAEYTLKENKELKEAKDEIDRLIKENGVIQGDYSKQLQTNDEFYARLRSSDARVRELTARAKSAIANASTDSVRNYAGGATDLYIACREEYIDLGRETVKAATAAHALKKSNDLLSHQPVVLPVPPIPFVKPSTSTK
jgi:hypothetical protein